MPSGGEDHFNIDSTIPQKQLMNLPLGTRLQQFLVMPNCCTLLGTLHPHILGFLVFLFYGFLAGVNAVTGSNSQMKRRNAIA